MLTINKTGLYTMQAMDLYRYMFGFEEEVADDFEYKEDMNNNKNEGILKEDDKNNNDNLLINWLIYFKCVYF